MEQALVEKVARAMRAALGVEWPHAGHQELFSIARAAIEAMPPDIRAAYKRGCEEGWKRAEAAAGIDIPINPEQFSGEINDNLPF